MPAKRGLTKTRAALHEWCKNVAPSTELRKWYGHDPDRFPEFTRRYRVELAAPERSDALSHLADELRGTGWPNEAEGVVAALDEIRGAYGGRNYPFDDSLIVVYDRLRQLSESPQMSQNSSARATRSHIIADHQYEPVPDTGRPGRHRHPGRSPGAPRHARSVNMVDADDEGEEA